MYWKFLPKFPLKKFHFFRFDYGEKFWVIKHKFFTCYCASDKCRYSRTNIANFLRDYYKKNGEQLPLELQQPNQSSASATTTKVSTTEKIEVPIETPPESLQNFNVKTENPEETIVAQEVPTVLQEVVKDEDKLKMVPKVILPLAKADSSIAILNKTDAKTTDTSNTQSSIVTVTTRPRRSVTRKTEENSNTK
jgi:hypothetical protein